MNFLSGLFYVAALGAACGGAMVGLPSGPLVMGYQNWGACNSTETVEAAQAGVNVVIWFAINLVQSPTGNPAISGGPDPQCVAAVAKQLVALQLPTTHLISIGGWDAPHPALAFSGKQFFAAFDAWNAALPHPFDGFDWDLEGNDDKTSPYNAFTPHTLDLIVDMSVAAKQSGRYAVTLVPPQSYFDVSSDGFSLSLLLSYQDFHPDFAYHGLNCYAYLVALAPAGTFDAVTVQLYESWSRADQQILQPPVTPPAAALQSWWQAILQPHAPALSSMSSDRGRGSGNGSGGWFVDFGDNATTGLRLGGRHAIVIEPWQLVVGLSRGSADGSGKSAFFWPSDVGKAYEATAEGERPRGFAFWNIAEEGSGANGTSVPLSFAPSLNAFLHTRPGLL